MKRLVIGILAHVDAGKTTLSEALLYHTGGIRKIGRVDHGDAFLDNFLMERERGITIFSKQAQLSVGDETEFVLIDTPGHADFSGETERTLRVLDYAILVVSGSDGVQSHTETLWRLLARYRIPTFIFVNKMDLRTSDRDALMRALEGRLSGACVDFSQQLGEEFSEKLSMLDEELLEKFASGKLTDRDKKETAVRLVSERRLFPVLFGSALRLEGISELISALKEYTAEKKYPSAFAARVYKISRDEAGTRLTHMKITGGELKNKTLLDLGGDIREKVDQIRVYSGAKFSVCEKVCAGQICTAVGLEHTYPGEGVGAELEAEEALLEPVMTYRVTPTDGCSSVVLFEKMRKIEEEEPLLHVVINEHLKEIHVRLMGEVQLEVISRLLSDRYGISVVFDEGSIVYKETIAAPVEGVGHFEPLRHYAEVHLLLEATPRGSGLSFDTLCSENVLGKNWQRLVLTHLAEKCHIGVLTGSPITDMRISLLTGRAHEKHTEGGDFREATYRAVRQGLMRAKSILLEPYYNFRLEVPKDCIGRAMADITARDGSFGLPELDRDGEKMLLSGSAAVSSLRGYASELASYSRGQGRLVCTFGGYRECHNTDEVVARIGYNAEADVENTADSVFCSHGAGTVVKWNEAESHMHVKSPLSPKEDAESGAEDIGNVRTRSYEENVLYDKELIAIFERTYGPIRPRALPPEKVVREYDEKKKQKAPKEGVLLPEYVLVDGYNIIFAWDDLKKIAEDNLNLARQLLINILCNYQGYVGCGLILVFDAYKVAGGRGSVEKHGGIHVVYTKEAETADAYIERVTLEMGKKYRVRVATSDRLEQIIVLGHGATRISARVFYEEVCEVRAHIDEELEKYGGQKDRFM